MVTFKCLTPFQEQANKSDINMDPAWIILLTPFVSVISAHEVLQKPETQTFTKTKVISTLCPEQFSKALKS